MTARRSVLPAPTTSARRRGGAGRRRRLAAALLSALILPLAACSLLSLDLGEPTDGEPSAATTQGDPSAGATDGPTGDEADFAATCTGEGRLQTSGSTQGTDHETQNATTAPRTGASPPPSCASSCPAVTRRTCRACTWARARSSTTGP